jgi:threonine dehydratase
MDRKTAYFQIDYEGAKTTSVSELREGAQGTIFVQVGGGTFANSVEDTSSDSAAAWICIVGFSSPPAKQAPRSATRYTSCHPAGSPSFGDAIKIAPVRQVLIR